MYLFLSLALRSRGSLHDTTILPVSACALSLSVPCRFGLASVLNVVIGSLEELFVEKCYDLITTAALRAMGGCKKLKV